MQVNEAYRVLFAKSLVLLAVALGDCNGTIIVDVLEQIIRNVPHTTETTTSIEESLEG